MDIDRNELINETFDYLRKVAVDEVSDDELWSEAERIVNDTVKDDEKSIDEVINDLKKRQ